MSDQQRQKRLLAVLLVVLVAFAGYRVMQLGGGETRAARRSAGANPVEGVLAQLAVPHLNLESLRREAATYKPGRDPFRFGPAPKPVAVAKPAPPKQRPAVKPRPKPAANRPAHLAVATPPAPVPPKVSFTYLGSFGPSDRRIAVFIKDDEIINALTGDVLLKNFIVDKIGFESADIKYVGFPDTPGTRLEAGG